VIVCIMTDNNSPQDILDFWFGAPDDPAFGEPREAWFKKDDAFDEQIRTRFGGAVDAAIEGGLSDWEDNGQGSLALILLLDQFARNIFRGSDKSFAGDVRTRRVAAAAIEAGIEKDLNISQRVFLYLPYEHSEDMADQHRSMELFNSLPEYEGRANQLDYAQRHFDIVERFGRFPHRNAAVGRNSTAEEIEFLEGPNSSF
jgi:uncharacterized protein (DUF924 family)